MFTDRPIEKSEDDILDRKDFSCMLGDVLISTKQNESLCVGLMGPWGSGKTSVINMAIEYICSEKRNPYVNVLRFEPWNYNTPEQLVNQFFVQLANLFEVGNEEKGKIGRAIVEYANCIETSAINSLLSITSPIGAVLSGLILGTIKKVGKVVANTEFQSKNVQKQKDELQELLEKVEEKIVIVIDDIDRLTDNQIRCIFQLVTIVCKFPNINYLLSFDREIVSRALDEVQNSKGNEFLDRVIQVPIIMPIIDRNKLFSILGNQLDQLIQKFKIHTLEENKWRELYGYCFPYLIKTQRDVLRLCNSLTSKLFLLSNDVDFVDLVTLTIIEQHEPSLYEWIKRNGGMLTGQLTYKSIFDHGNTDQDKRKRKVKYEEEIKGIIQHKTEFIPDFVIEKLCILFPAFSSHIGGYHKWYSQDTLRKNNSVGHAEKFDRYFVLDMENGQITNSELLYIINEASEDEIAGIIAGKDAKGASIELFNEINVHIETLNVNRMETLIYGIQKAGDSLKTESSNGLVNLLALTEAAHNINQLLLHLKKEKRFLVLNNMICNMCISNVDVVSLIIHGVCIAHSMIIDDDERDRYERYPSLESDDKYKIIERRYKEKIKEIRDNIDSIDLIDKQNFIHFYKKFPVGKKYIKQIILSNPKNILYYVNKTMRTWHNAGEKKIEAIEFEGNYKEFVSKAEILNAINILIETKEYAVLDNKLQITAAAFLMTNEKERTNSERLLYNDVEKRRNEILYSIKQKGN